MTPSFTDDELAYLRGQRLARLATVDAGGTPQNNPVGFFLDDDRRTVVIGGTDLARSRKFRNVRRHPGVALVVDDLAPGDTWQVRGVEVRGTAEAVEDVDPPSPGLSRQLIRITPHWIGSWGLTPGSTGLTSRGGPGAPEPAGTAVPRLVDTYFRGFDERRHDEAWLGSILSPGVTTRFPAGSSTGLPEVAATQARILGLWAATLHQTTNHHVVGTARGAEFSAALTATHVHRADDPGAPLRIGARVTGAATPGPHGWRIDDLALDLVWTEGDGPR